MKLLTTHFSLLTSLLLLLLCGCHSGARIVASSASATNLGNVTFDGNEWPILSIASGPKLTAWIREDNSACVSSIECTGSVTNTTSALGCYTSTEKKSVTLRLNFATNSIPTIH